MNDKVIVIRKNGETITLKQWQFLYSLDDPKKIGRHFSLTEGRFEKDLVLYGQLVVNELLIRVLDTFRDAVECPVTINSFNRNQERQDELKKEGLKAAKYSPHVVKLAADIDTKTVKQTREWVKYLKQVADILGIKIRIGFEQYLKAGQTFIHVDVCPEYYAPGKPWHNESHPRVWEKPITW
jgi:hypothetical protein